MRDHGLRIGVDPDSTLITQARSWQIVTSLLESRTLPLPNESLSHNASATLVLADSLSQNLLTIEEAAKDLADLDRAVHRPGRHQGLQDPGRQGARRHGRVGGPARRRRRAACAQTSPRPARLR